MIQKSDERRALRNITPGMTQSFDDRSWQGCAQEYHVGMTWQLETADAGGHALLEECEPLVLSFFGARVTVLSTSREKAQQAR